MTAPLIRSFQRGRFCGFTPATPFSKVLLSRTGLKGFAGFAGSFWGLKAVGEARTPSPSVATVLDGFYYCLLKLSLFFLISKQGCSNTTRKTRKTSFGLKGS